MSQHLRYVFIFFAVVSVVGCQKHSSDPVLLTVTTLAVSQITSVSATGGGTVIPDRLASVTSRGVCWSKVPHPTTSDAVTSDGTGAGDFLSSITDLSANTVYYIRAYATSDAGIAYGNEISFSTPPLSVELEAIKDTSIFNNLAGDSPEKDYGAGASQVLRVGYSGSEDVYARSLIQFDLSAVPQHAIVDSVSLLFTAGKTGTNVPVISVYKVTQAWSEGTTTDICDYFSPCQVMGSPIEPGGTDATWIHTRNTSDSWSVEGGSFAAASSATSEDLGATIDLFVSDGMAADVQSWLDTPATNYGWILKVDEPTVSGTGAMKRYVSKDFVPEEGHMANKPRLYIQYH